MIKKVVTNNGRVWTQTEAKIHHGFTWIHQIQDICGNHDIVNISVLKFLNHEHITIFNDTCIEHSSPLSYNFCQDFPTSY
jgi:hypothetical protein